jgi:leucyl-tRNA synthetase
MTSPSERPESADIAPSDRYDHRRIEAKWQERWRDADLFKADADHTKPKLYGLEMFPYPSGAGLSVGHFKNYAPTDAFLRYKAMCGYNVLHPMGWDAFGQPAENEAIKRKRNPREMVRDYAANYKRQLNLIGMAYDWDREINSSDPEYYRWTQWVFLYLFKQGLAYRAEAPVNWCPVDKTVLANEEVVNGRCWRCETIVEKRMMPQWFFKITAYAERLLADLDGLDWPEGIKAMQRNWIGRSEGAEVDFQLAPPSPNSGGAGVDSGSPIIGADGLGPIRVFTTRPDTLWGATFMVLAPEHPLVDKITTPAQRVAVQDYVLRTQRETEIDRQAEGKEKTGVWTGAYAINPVNGDRIPIWIADYVLMGYGTGAIMAVPAHDQRDFEFARKFDLLITPVYRKPGESFSGAEMTAATVDEGVIGVGSPFDGLPYTKETVSKVAHWLVEKGIGKPTVTYRFRDWLISRQRYWGAPIPIVHCPKCGEVAVPDDELPVRLPDIESYAPSGTGESPLATIADWVNTTCPVCAGPARRETDTMGGFACSSWYFLRFADPHNSEAPWSREAADYWLPVDIYAGGAEHAVMHLLYARFWTKVFYDGNLIGFTEPFKTLRNQGSMLAWTPGRKPAQNEGDSGEDSGGGAEEHVIDWKVLKPEELATFPPEQIIWRWARQSKSRGNVVTPDEVAKEFGADALRTYEMFVAPFEEDVQWSKDGIRGSAKFLGRVWRIVDQHAAGFDRKAWRDKIADSPNKALRRKTHQTIAKVGDDIDGFRFNTAVAALMELVNTIYDASAKAPRDRRDAAIDEAVETLVMLISPIAPHLADELWERLGQTGYLYKHPWPEADPAVARADEITLVVQINGKVRDKLTAAADSDSASLQELALTSPRIKELLAGQPPKKVIVVPGKLVNIVV